ncbi:MAG: hypothetical protein SOZ62_05735 [Eubacteriales bacterium]|nr:hypothetical protein [Eubacteriales bacterium]
MSENNTELSELLAKLRQSVRMYDSTNDKSDKDDKNTENDDGTYSEEDNAAYSTENVGFPGNNNKTDENSSENVDFSDNADGADKSSSENVDFSDTADVADENSSENVGFSDTADGADENSSENVVEINSENDAVVETKDDSICNVQSNTKTNDDVVLNSANKNNVTSNIEYSDDFAHKLADKLADILEGRLYDKNHEKQNINEVSEKVQITDKEPKNDIPIEESRSIKKSDDLPRFKYRDGLFGEVKTAASESDDKNKTRVFDDVDSDRIGIGNSSENNIKCRADEIPHITSKPKNMIKVYSSKDELNNIFFGEFTRENKTATSSANMDEDDDDLIYATKRSDMYRYNNASEKESKADSGYTEENIASDTSILKDDLIDAVNDYRNNADTSYNNGADNPINEKLSDKNFAESDDADYIAASDRDNIEFGIAVPEKKITADEIGNISMTTQKSDNPRDDSRVKPKGREYSSNSQNIELFNEFKRQKISVCARLFTAILFTVVMFFEENFAVFGKTLGHTFSTVLDILLIVFMGTLAVTELKDGITPIKRGKANPATVIFFGISVTLVYDFIILFFASEYTLMYGLPIALGVDLLILGTLMEVFGTEYSFSVVSSSGDKLVCDICDTTEKERESGSGDRAVRIKKTGFVDGFMKNRNRPPHESVFDLAISVASFVLSLAAACVYGIVNSFTVESFMSLSSLAFSLLLATGLICSRIYSFFCISKRASETGSAIIGDGAVSEYSSVKDIFFEDVEAFPSSLVKVVKIKLTSDSVLNKVLYYMAGAFSCVGGPLESVFGVASGELGTPQDVTITDISDFGISAFVEGINICIGKKDYLIDMGYVIPDDGEDERRTKAGPVSILYVASDGKYSGKFYIQYSFDRNFARRVADMSKYGIKTHIRTFDPNIDDDLLRKTIKLSKPSINVVKKNRREMMDFGAPKVDSTLITRYTTAQLIKIIMLTKRAKRLSLLADAVKIIAMSGGVCIVAAIIGFPMLSGTLSSVYAFLYQSFFGLILALTTKLKLK